MTLDAELLRLAQDIGCELVRSSTIKDFELGGIGKNSVTYKTKDGSTHKFTASWIIDASGKAAKIAKMRKTWRSNSTDHPTAAIWTRFKNVNFLDSHDGAKQMKHASSQVLAQRGF